MRFFKRILRFLNSLRLLSRTRYQGNTAFLELPRLNALEARIHRLETALSELFELTLRGHGQQDAATAAAAALADRMGTLERDAETLKHALAAQLEGQARGLEQALAGQRDRLETQGRQLAVALAMPPAAAAPTAGGMAVPPRLMDGFYVALEARFRGDMADIARRQAIHLPDIEAACERAGARTVLDLGCGRGEWLQLLGERGIEAIGVDTNEGQLASARAAGLAVSNQDGLAFLRAQPEGRFAAITAFHLVEHLPFDVLAAWMAEIARVLRPGGILLAETPNPENLLVGASSFHLDPTHVRPLPKGLLSVLAETVGLRVAATRPLHPHARLEQALREMPETLAYLLFGHQDYALVAQRPGGSRAGEG